MLSECLTIGCLVGCSIASSPWDSVQLVVQRKASLTTSKQISSSATLSQVTWRLWQVTGIHGELSVILVLRASKMAGSLSLKNDVQLVTQLLYVLSSSSSTGSPFNAALTYKEQVTPSVLLILPDPPAYPRSSLRDSHHPLAGYHPYRDTTGIKGIPRN